MLPQISIIYSVSSSMSFCSIPYPMRVSRSYSEACSRQVDPRSARSLACVSNIDKLDMMITNE